MKSGPASWSRRALFVLSPSALEEGALPFDKRADGQKGQAEGGDEGIAPRPLPEGEIGPHAQWPGIKDVAARRGEGALPSSPLGRGLRRAVFAFMVAFCCAKRYQRGLFLASITFLSGYFWRLFAGIRPFLLLPFD